MASKNNKYMTTHFKVDESKTNDDSTLARVNPQVRSPLIRRMTKAFRQTNMEAQSTSTPVFLLTPTKFSFSMLRLKDVDASIEKTFIMLKVCSDFKILMHDDDLSSCNLVFSHSSSQPRFLPFEVFVTASISSVMPTLMSQTLTLEEQVGKLGKDDGNNSEAYKI